MIRWLLLIPVALAMLLLGAVARRVPQVAAGMAVTDAQLARLVRGESLPDSIFFGMSDSLENVAAGTGGDDEAGAVARFGAALRAGPYEVERSGAWATALNQVLQWPPGDDAPTMSWIRLADGRTYAVLASTHDGRWYVLGGESKPFVVR